MLDFSKQKHCSLINFILIGFIFAFLVFVVYCVSFHNISECPAHLFLISNSFSKRMFLFYSALLALIISNSIILIEKNHKFFAKNLFPLFYLKILRFNELDAREYHSILKTFRRGILRPKIFTAVSVWLS